MRVRMRRSCGMRRITWGIRRSIRGTSSEYASHHGRFANSGRCFPSYRLIANGSWPTTRDEPPTTETDMIKAVRGTRDLLPPETGLWNFVESAVRDVFRA